MTEKLLTVNQYSRPKRALVFVRGVVVHYVGVANQRPSQTVAYFESLKSGKFKIYASAHYVIGTDGEVIRCIPENEIAYHCGAKQYKKGITEKLGKYPNHTTIGIEMCHTKDGFTEATLHECSKLVAQILKAHGLTEKDVYRHYDITGKLCPLFFVEDEEQWHSFLSRVKKELANV